MITLDNFKVESDASNPSRQAGAPSNLEEQLNIFLAGLPISQFKSVEVAATEALAGFYGTISYKVDSAAPLPITAGTDGDWVRKQVILLDDDDMYTHQASVNAALTTLDPDTTYTFSLTEEAFSRFMTVIVYEKTFTP